LFYKIASSVFWGGEKKEFYTKLFLQIIVFKAGSHTSDEVKKNKKIKKSKGQITQLLFQEYPNLCSLLHFPHFSISLQIIQVLASKQVDSIIPHYYWTTKQEGTVNGGCLKLLSWFPPAKVGGQRWLAAKPPIIIVSCLYMNSYRQKKMQLLEEKEKAQRERLEKQFREENSESERQVAEKQLIEKKSAERKKERKNK